jgi:hypothetical protein
MEGLILRPHTAIFRREILLRKLLPRAEAFWPEPRCLLLHRICKAKPKKRRSFIEFGAAELFFKYEKIAWTWCTIKNVGCS